MLRRSFLCSTLAAICARSAPSSSAAVVYAQGGGIWIHELPDQPRRIVSGSKLSSPRLSGSGKWLSYVGSGTLHVIGADGSGDRSFKGLENASESQWWPGRDILLVPAPEGFALYTADDGWHDPLRRLFDGMLPAAFSPDGNEFVYADEAPPGHGNLENPIRTGRLWRVRGTEDPKLVVSEEGARPIPAAWGPSGILYWEDPDFSSSVMADGIALFQVPTSGGDPKPLGISTLVHPDTLSLDSAHTRLALSAGTRRDEWLGKRVAVIDLRSGAVSYRTEEGISAVWPAWSPDGSSLVYSAAPGEDAGGGEPARRVLSKRRIWLVDAAGTKPAKQLTGDEAYRDESPVFSRDGKLIIFARLNRNSTASLWTMQPDGTGLTRIAELAIDDADSWFGYYGHIDWRALWS
jgi:dipeptidyl aminopeptidase/acylaminoacyl peptidase